METLHLFILFIYLIYSQSASHLPIHYFSCLTPVADKCNIVKSILLNARFVCFGSDIFIKRIKMTFAYNDILHISPPDSP